MAEFLVYAKNSWQDDLEPEDLAERLKDPSFEAAYNARLVKGDIIVVKPDGHRWSPKEGRPTFVVVKVPGLSVEDVLHYSRPLTKVVDEKTVILKERQYQIPSLVVDGVVGSDVNVSEVVFDGYLTDKND